MGTGGAWAGFIPVAVWRQRAVRAEYQSSKLARQSGLCPRTLRRHFRRQFHTTPQRWLDRQRVFMIQYTLARPPRTRTSRGLGPATATMRAQEPSTLSTSWAGPEPPWRW